jgi:regulator of RNase E activity RraA
MGPPLSPETRDRLLQVSTATLATQLVKLGFRNTYLTGLRPPAREDLATYARLGDPAYPQRHAIERIAPGQVLVMDCRGVAGAAAAGDILIARLQARGAAGLVADGGIRDWQGAQALGLPAYALGPAAPAHVVRHLAVDEDVPIGCADVLIVPGDVMVGDDDGVVCVPRHVADQVAADGFEQDRLEAFLLERIKQGAPLPGTYPPSAETLAEYEARRRER